MEQASHMFATFWALVPPLVAIALALITKEVYLSLFLGIICGALFYTNFNPIMTVTSIFETMVDNVNLMIIIFLIMLGMMVALMNAAGGSAAYGRWAAKHIKSRTGTLLATFALGVLIFVDDYFNCLTVGSVMRPVADKHRISREKLAYIIDATAAPVCIIAPVSSWAAAVTSSLGDSGADIDGFAMFIQAIPYNLYALLTLIMVITISIGNLDFGAMRRAEELIQAKIDVRESAEEEGNPNGKVIDLILPVVVLILGCVCGLLYTGGFFTPDHANFLNFITGFSDCNSSLGLVIGAFVALLFTFVYYMCRRVITFKGFTDCLPQGFKAMVPAVLILTLAWTLQGFVNALGATEFIKTILTAENINTFGIVIPAILFLMAFGISFATGTSWGTMAILLPIVVALPFIELGNSTLLVISIAASMAGAVCGDHCSPISDTTIMSSAGAGCDHIKHVNTQMPYAMLVAGVSFVGYLLCGVLQSVLGNWTAVIVLPVSAAALIGILIGIRAVNNKKA
ncbi:MAG: Na+/H+ antiporter NhaC family protein [Clostridia bacterium]|nr:Na+/H+ antiporter NhaC family protein [Clostridia bacterium]